MSPGSVIAERFEVGAEIGAGGMGRVYRARDRESGQDVALKVVTDADGGERFRREVDVLAALEHPAIVRYVAHGELPDGAPYLAMEWLDGEDLAARLGRGPLPLPDALSIARQLGEALAVTHARGIIHRDLKPANVYVLRGAELRVKLLDFGIARGGGLGQGATRTGMLVGTPAYMSPEQARGERSLGPPTDVFALGCVLYECLAGVPAFVGSHVVAVLAKVLLEEAPSLAERGVAVPARIEALLRRMLAKDPAERLPDAPALLRALDGLEDGHAETLAAPARPVPLGAREERRLFVVMATDREDPPPGDPAARPGTTAGLRAIGESFGARVEKLRDGTLVAIVEPDASATDAASIAARCALTLARQLGARQVALATGRGRKDAGVPVGEAIERAARQLALAAADTAGSVRVDEGTAALLDARFEVSGDAQGLVLCGERVEGDAMARRLLGRPSPCVGRERELGLLIATLGDCISEPAARAVLVTAGPGVGKSRLRHELFGRIAAQAEPVEIWLARADVMRRGSAFGLLGDVLRACAGIQEGESADVRRRKLRARVGRHGAPDPDALAELLGEVAGVPVPEDEASPALGAARRDPRLMAERTRWAWETFVQAECAAHAVVLVLEDVHWGDLPSLRYVDHALRRLEEAPLMVLATARPEVHETFPRLWAERGVVEIRLPELTRRAAERLVTSALGERASPELVQRLWALSHGNAFYLEELVRVVAAGRATELPESVLAMAEVRFAALEPEARQLLRAASVLGEVFWTGAVAAVLDAKPEAVAPLLAELERRELVERRAESRFRGEPDHAFRHALLREAAYASLVSEDRAQAHARAAAWLARAGETAPLVLAEHHERAGQVAEAARHLCLAAQQALLGGDGAGALSRARRGLEGGATGELAIELRMAEIEARTWLGQREQTTPLARQLVDETAPGSPIWYRAIGTLVIGREDDLDRCERALLEVEVGPSSAVPFVVSATRVVTQMVIRAAERSTAALLERIREHLPAAAARQPSVGGWVAMMEAFRAARHGGLDRSLALFGESAAVFRAAGDLPNALAQEVDACFALMALGRYEEVIARADALGAEAASLGLDRVRKTSIAPRALAAAYLGHAEELPHLFSYVFSAKEIGPETLPAITGIWTVATRVLTGRPAPSHAEVVALAEARDALPHWLGPLTVPIEARLGLLWLGAGEPQRALDRTEGAELHAFASVFDRADEILLLLVRGRALLALGKAEGAELLREGRRLVLERAGRIEDPALRQGFLERVAEHRVILAETAALPPPP